MISTDVIASLDTKVRVLMGHNQSAPQEKVSVKSVFGDQWKQGFSVLSICALTFISFLVSSIDGPRTRM